MLRDLQRHHAIGQKLQRPTSPARRLGATGNGDQFRLFFSIEYLLRTGPNLLFALQRRLQTFLHEPLAEILHRANADAKRPRRFDILHLQARVRFIRRQQNIGVSDAISRRLSGADQLLQTFPFFGLQPNDILFHIDPP
jgi:hypothetical protein